MCVFGHVEATRNVAVRIPDQTVSLHVSRSDTSAVHRQEFFIKSCT